MNKREIRDAIIETQEEIAKELEKFLRYDEAISLWENIGKPQEATRIRKLVAEEREKHLDYENAIKIYEEINMPKEAARVRKLKANLAAPKTEIHGDYVDDRDTIVKDSVVNRSNVGAGGKTKGERIKLIKELLDSGAIDKDDYEKMKREIIG